MSQKRHKQQKSAKQRQAEHNLKGRSRAIMKASLMRYFNPCDYHLCEPIELQNSINKRSSPQYHLEFLLPERIVKTASEPQKQYIVYKLWLSKQKKSEGCDEQPELQKFIEQNSIPHRDYLSPSVNEKMLNLIIRLLKCQRWQDNIQQSEVFRSNFKQQLTYIKNESQRYQNLVGSCKKIKQKLGHNSLDSLLLPQYIHNRKIIKELHHILVEIRQNQQQLHSSIEKLHQQCQKMLIPSQQNHSIKQVQQWITLYLFTNNYYYSLQKVKIHQQMKELINKDQYLREIYPQSKSQIRKSTCFYIQQFLDKMILAMNQLYDSVPLSRNIKKMIEVQDLWVNQTPRNHQNQFIQGTFKKAIAQDWLKMPWSILQNLLKATTSYPESNQYHHSLFHPSGQNLLRFFTVLRELNKIFYKFPKVREYDLSFISKFVKQRLNKLEELIDSLQMPSGKFINYDIHKRVTLLIYVYAQIASMLGQHYLQTQTLQDIKKKIEDKLHNFQEKLESLRCKDQTLSTEEINLFEKIIAQCQTIDGFSKQAKKQVQDKDVTSQKLLFGMIDIIRKDFKNGNKEKNECNQ